MKRLSESEARDKKRAIERYYLEAVETNKEACHWFSLTLSLTLSCQYLFGREAAALVFIFLAIPAYRRYGMMDHQAKAVLTEVVQFNIEYIDSLDPNMQAPRMN